MADASVDAQAARDGLVREDQQALRQPNLGKPIDGSQSNGHQDPAAERADQSKGRQVRKLEVPEYSIYDSLISDIERMTQVLPIKTRVQRDLDDAHEQIRALTAKVAQQEKAIAKQAKELKELRDRGTELVTELVEQQTEYGTQIQALKAAGARRVEEVRRLEAEKFAHEQALGANGRPQGTQTVLDGESETILQQQEFS